MVLGSTPGSGNLAGSVTFQVSSLVLRLSLQLPKRWVFHKSFNARLFFLDGRFGATLSCAQGLLLAVCSGSLLKGLTRPYAMPRAELDPLYARQATPPLY